MAGGTFHNDGVGWSESHGEYRKNLVPYPDVGFTLSFEGKTRTEPIAVVRTYGVDVDDFSVTISGDLAELALARPDRVRVTGRNGNYYVSNINRHPANTVRVVVCRSR